MNEKTIERQLRERVKALGGLAVKLFSPYYTGLPDRLVLLPGGITLFAEIKTTGKKAVPKQDNRIARLKAAGFKVFVIDSQAGLDMFMECAANEISTV